MINLCNRIKITCIKIIRINFRIKDNNVWNDH
jgi:hypothetical protein